MNCRSFRKYLGAFADGELDTATNLEALEHLNFCESCATKVAGIQEIKRGLTRVFAEERVPDGLKSRVRARIAACPGQPALRPSRLQKWVVPLGMAAAIVFAWQVSVLFYRPAVDDFVGGPRNAVEAQWVQAVRIQHKDCTKLGLKHHRESLPIDLRLISVELSKELGLPVLAPNLSSLGFVLVGADACGLNHVPGAHIVYQHEREGWLLSIFSLSPLDTFRPTAGFRVGSRECFVCTDPGPAMVAWHESGVTYLFCGKVGVQRLKELVRQADTLR